MVIVLLILIYCFVCWLDTSLKHIARISPSEISSLKAMAFPSPLFNLWKVQCPWVHLSVLTLLQWWLTNSWSIFCHSIFLLSQVHVINRKKDQTKSQKQHHQTCASLGFCRVGRCYQCLELFQLVKKRPKKTILEASSIYWHLQVPNHW